MTTVATVMIDVRTDAEWRRGHIPDALHIPLDQLSNVLPQRVANRTAAIICYCQSGQRSQQAVHTLRALGYVNAQSLDGGIDAWQSAGKPVTARELVDPWHERYQRHLAIPEIGEVGQKKLQRARVALIGAGGLGCPAALYLTAAGVGTIDLIDDDRVGVSNLQRQILYATDMVGTPKVESARRELIARNADVQIIPHAVRVTEHNVAALIAEADVVVDGSDNFSTRYLLNDACLSARKPLIHGSVQRFAGQVSLFCTASGPCYRCLYPVPPPPEIAPNCAEAGVLGVLPGLIGTLQATEALKYILQIGEPLVGRVLCFDALTMQTTTYTVERDPACRCANNC